MLDISLIGTGGMMPLPNRFLSSLICRFNGNSLLIDCGEGTQVTLKLLGWGFKNIGIICITHFHADHISGLPGLLLTIGNSGRTEPLTMIGPRGLGGIVKSLCVIAPELPFDIVTYELDSGGSSLIENGFIINTYPMEHRMPCYAYRLDIERRGKFDAERARALGVPLCCWSMLQKKDKVEFDGKVYTSDMVLGAPRKGIRVSYCTDSRPVDGLADFAAESDLFVCEGIYGEDDKLEKAISHRHMIFREAAQIAKDAGVKELWLTHFSPAMPNPGSYIQYARSIFPDAIIGYDRLCKTIVFEN